MKASEQLRAARDWLTPERFIQYYSMYPQRPAQATPDWEPDKACAVGALSLFALRWVDTVITYTWLSRAGHALYGMGAAGVNDALGYEAVMRMYGYAIELAEASEAKQARTTPRAPDPTPASSGSGSPGGTPSRELVPC